MKHRINDKYASPMQAYFFKIRIFFSMLSAMSSTKHQPKLGKRPYSQVEPEFPRLPKSLAFGAAEEFARKSQEALIAVQQELPMGATFPGQSFIFLPLISPHQLQQRFNVGEDESVLVVATKSYPALKDQVNSLDNKKYSGLYVR